MLRGGSAFKDLRGAARAEKSLNAEGGSAFKDLRGGGGGSAFKDLRGSRGPKSP